MGWTSLHRDKGMTDRAFFEQEFPRGLTEQGEILDSATVSNTFYAAVRDRDSGNVWALVVLIRRQRGHYNFAYKDMDERMGPVEARCPTRILDLLTPLPDCQHEEQYCRHCYTEIAADGDHWVRKDVVNLDPKHAGPRCTIGAPYGLTAPDGGNPFHEPGGTPHCADCWAREWRERCRAAAAAQDAARKVTPGTRVRFAQPLRFTNGETHDTLVFDQRSTFHVPGRPGTRFRISNWRLRAFEILDVA